MNIGRTPLPAALVSRRIGRLNGQPANERAARWPRPVVSSVTPKAGATSNNPLSGTAGLIGAFSPADAARLFGRRIMTTLKTLTMTSALLLGGVSLAIAQGPPTGGYPPVGGGAGGNPATNPVTPGPPGPGVIPGAPASQAATSPTRTRIAHQPTKHHNKLYMSINRTHKGSKMNQ